MKRFFYFLIVSAFSVILIGCQSESTDHTTQIITEPNIDICECQFNSNYGEEITIQEIDIPYSQILTNTYNFISSCKNTDEHALIISDSILKTHQVYLSFDAVYPIEYIVFNNYIGSEASSISEISIEISIDGYTYDKVYNDLALVEGENRIEMDNKMVKSVKFVFDDLDDSKVGIQDINFKLGEGIIIHEETELTNMFVRYSGWTGADGIFTFDLDNGGDTVGLEPSNIGFIFSDTFIGDVNETNHLRKNSVMINNTFGYLEDDEMTYVWDDSGEEPGNVLNPDEYIGQRVRNLLDGDGLSVTNQPTATFSNSAEGLSWLSNDLKSELVIDLESTYDVNKIYIWNYNATPDYGVKMFDLYISENGIDYTKTDSYTIAKANGTDTETNTLELTLDSNLIRYIKMVVTDSYSETYVGLGKIMLFNSSGQCLFGNITATSEEIEITQNEESARLWIQDGIVLNDKLYVFPILVKDYLTYFSVNSVSLVEMDIIDNHFDYQNATFFNTPLKTITPDGGVIYFGAGVLDNRSIDGYIYVYGYKDLNGRELVVSRVTEENFLNFNEWTYYNGTNWVKDINQCAPLINSVSAELSVTYIEEGIFAGKYMLVVMENTTSGNVVYSLSDTPTGTFSEYTLIYKSTESKYLSGAFAYNAKLHPALSTDDKLIVSYNVNTTNIGALSNAEIYYPRFISITYVKKDES